jgi:hypothetical protein
MSNYANRSPKHAIEVMCPIDDAQIEIAKEDCNRVLYMPVIGGPYPWTVLGVLQLQRGNHVVDNKSIFRTHNQALERARELVDEKNKCRSELNALDTTLLTEK